VVNSTYALRSTHVPSLLNISRINTIQRPNNLHKQFVILRKLYHRKYECLIYQMLLTRKMRLWTHTHTYTRTHTQRLHSSETVLLHVSKIHSCMHYMSHIWSHASSWVREGLWKYRKHTVLKEIKICQVPSCVDF